ncbi:MAG TPA: dTDP-4-dehydrorhamnose reductase [Balneolaceae bacterium]|nr:dTDP-4-dehydrorhamnose reductase [Balneolaceae bacterium]
MKFLITGAGGQLGREWSEMIRLENLEFTACDSTELDITDADRIRTVIKSENPDVIINCAAYTDVEGAEDHPDKAFQVNRDAVRNLAAECKKNDTILVHFSTDYVFPGKSADMKHFPDGYPEEAETGPINLYGKSKLEGEIAIRESGADHLIIRVSWLCGKYGGNFVKTMLRLSEERENLKVVHDQYGSPTFVESLIPATHYLIDAEKRGTYHYTSKGIITWHEFATAIFEISDRKVAIQPVQSEEFNFKAERPAFSKLSTKKIESLNSELTINWKTGLQNLLNQL